MSKMNESPVNRFAPKTFAFSLKKKDALLNSSSGGAFFVLATYVIRLGGVVFGARFEPNGRVVHDMAENLKDVRPFMKSKYVRSDLRNTFALCQKSLLEGKLVLFTGTPCQINALHIFLDMRSVNKDRLVSADIVCHGTPKPVIWERYLREINYAEGDMVDFRYKKPSWERYALRVGNVVAPTKLNPYFWLFLHNYSLTDSCYACKAKGENRRSDITLGDFWGINNVDASQYNKRGVSLIIVRRRLDLIDAAFGGSISAVPYAPSIMENSSYYLSARKPEDQKNFYSMLETLSVSETAVKLGMPKHSVPWYKRLYTWMSIKTRIPKKNLQKKALCDPRKGKVGIISDFGYGNFGNKLQNYALKAFIEKHFGTNCENIVYTDYRVAKERAVHFIFRMLLHPRTFFQSLPKTPLERRSECIKKASKKYEKLFFHRYGLRQEKKLGRYNKIIFGSDQIWNYGYHKEDIAFNFGYLGISGMPIPLFAYAASIGQETIEDWVRPLFKEGLHNFKKISVRELSAVRLLKEEFGVKSKLCLDPTLLLSKEEWCSAISKYSSRSLPKKPYALLYIFEEEEQRDAIKLELKEKGIEFIDLFEQNDDYYVSNQFDFINLIAHAKRLYTNSFHGVLFSLVFSTPFVLLSRSLMSTAEGRITTLLSLTGLAEKIVYGEEYIPVPYSTLCNAMEKARRESEVYLEEIMREDSKIPQSDSH